MTMSEHRTTTPSDNTDTSTPEGDSNELYSVLENALRNQLHVLRNSRVSNLEGAKSPGTEDDDEMDNELSRLEEAERAMGAIQTRAGRFVAQRNWNEALWEMNEAEALVRARARRGGSRRAPRR